MTKHLKIIKDDEIQFREIFQLFRQKSKIIVLITMIFFVLGVFHGFFYPKEYECSSIIEIGKISNLRITTPKDLVTSLELITVPDYTEKYSTDKLKYNFKSNTNVKIKAISRSPNRAYELNKAILDTIINRHNNLINTAASPLDMTIKNITHQIDYFTSFDNEKQLDDYLTPISLLNDSRTELIKERTKYSPTRVVIKPKLPKSYTRPLWWQSISLSLLIGLMAGIVWSLLFHAYSSNNNA